LQEILEGDGVEPSREEVVAELVLFMRETVRELGEHRATGFLKKFYGWYLGRGRFPRAFKAELTQLPTISEVEARLLRPRPGPASFLHGSRRRSRRRRGPPRSADLDLRRRLTRKSVAAQATGRGLSRTGLSKTPYG
jgi:hypothetical protein